MRISVQIVFCSLLCLSAIDAAYTVFDIAPEAGVNRKFIVIFAFFECQLIFGFSDFCRSDAASRRAVGQRRFGDV